MERMNPNPMRGMVAEKYGSCERLAEKLGWSSRKTRDIVSGRQMPTAKDIEEMAVAFEIENDPAEFMRVFFPKQSTKRVQ